MKPFRKHAAIAIDGGGIRGVMVTTALEAAVGKNLGDVFEMAAGTSTGSIIASAIALNLRASEMTTMYRTISPKLFAKSWRSYLWVLANYRYSHDELARQMD